MEKNLLYLYILIKRKTINILNRKPLNFYHQNGQFFWKRNAYNPVTYRWINKLTKKKNLNWNKKTWTELIDIDGIPSLNYWYNRPTYPLKNVIKKCNLKKKIEMENKV